MRKSSRHDPRRVMARVALAIGILVILMILGAALAPASFWRWLIVHEISRATGRPVQIAGNVTVHLFRANPELSIEGLSIANPAWAASRDMLSVKKFDATLSLKSLLTVPSDFPASHDRFAGHRCGKGLAGPRKLGFFDCGKARGEQLRLRTAAHTRNTAVASHPGHARRHRSRPQIDLQRASFGGRNRQRGRRSRAAGARHRHAQRQAVSTETRWRPAHRRAALQAVSIRNLAYRRGYQARRARHHRAPFRLGGAAGKLPCLRQRPRRCLLSDGFGTSQYTGVRRFGHAGARQAALQSR